MKLDLSVLDGTAGKQPLQAELPVLDGADLDTGAFALPPVQDVSAVIAAHYECTQASATILTPGHLSQIDGFEREVIEMVKPAHGTTTLGFIFEGGVIIAVDSRATMGSYICERLHPSVGLCWALHVACTHDLMHHPILSTQRRRP